jgi:hypothetical protein
MKNNAVEFAKWWKSVYKEKLSAVYIDERFTNNKRYEMKTITEHNDQAIQTVAQLASRTMAGVLCDKCKVEMYYMNPNMVLACIPPKMTVVCPNCSEVNYKIR